MTRTTDGAHTVYTDRAATHSATYHHTRHHFGSDVRAFETGALCEPAASYRQEYRQHESEMSASLGGSREAF